MLLVSPAVATTARPADSVRPGLAAGVLTKLRWRVIGIGAVHSARAPGKYGGLPTTVITTDRIGVRVFRVIDPDRVADLGSHTLEGTWPGRGAPALLAIAHPTANHEV